MEISTIRAKHKLQFFSKKNIFYTWMKTGNRNCSYWGGGEKICKMAKLCHCSNSLVHLYFKLEISRTTLPSCVQLKLNTRQCSRKTALAFPLYIISISSYLFPSYQGKESPYTDNLYPTKKDNDKLYYKMYKKHIMVLIDT